jgi:hypothetical protein
METHVVLRSFSAEGRQLESGDTVDASPWPNARLLVAQGYLAPLSPWADGDEPPRRRVKRG